LHGQIARLDIDKERVSEIHGPQKRGLAGAWRANDRSFDAARLYDLLLPGMISIMTEPPVPALLLALRKSLPPPDARTAPRRCVAQAASGIRENVGVGLEKFLGRVYSA
jgi:hypothetical protein